MSKPQALCIYCGRPGVTKEHIWGKWSRNLAFFKAARSKHVIENYVNSGWTGPKTSKKGALDRPGATRSQTLKIACKNCNTGWMKGNVDAAIPILTRLHGGDWQNVQDDERDALCRWIAQFVMSYEYADRATAKIPQSVRSTFAETGDITGSWIIAVGHAIPLIGNDPAFHRSFGFIDNDGSMDPAQVTAFMFGELFALAIYCSLPIPPTILSVVAELGLCIIHPKSGGPFVRPADLHSEYTIRSTVDAVSAAFDALTRTLPSA